jgi:hypothetical protein
MPGGAPATPPAPVVTATQAGPLKAQLTSSTGTHWAWTFKTAAGAVVGTSALQNPLQTFTQAGDYTATVDATDDDPVATAPASGGTNFHVYNTPTASFTYTVLAGGAVQFTDTSTGDCFQDPVASGADRPRSESDDQVAFAFEPALLETMLDGDRGFGAPRGGLLRRLDARAYSHRDV